MGSEREPRPHMGAGQGGQVSLSSFFAGTSLDSDDGEREVGEGGDRTAVRVEQVSRGSGVTDPVWSSDQSTVHRAVGHGRTRHGDWSKGVAFVGLRSIKSHAGPVSGGDDTGLQGAGERHHDRAGG